MGPKPPSELLVRLWDYLWTEFRLPPICFFIHRLSKGCV